MALDTSDLRRKAEAAKGRPSGWRDESSRVRITGMPPDDTPSPAEILAILDAIDAARAEIEQSYHEHDQLVQQLNENGIQLAQLRAERDEAQNGWAECHNSLHARIAALEAQVASDAFVLVPREATEEMIEAGRAVTATWRNIQGSGLTIAREKMRLRYAAMIAAYIRARALKEDES